MVGTRVGGGTDMSGRLLRLVKALARSIAMELGLDSLIYWIEGFKDSVQCVRVGDAGAVPILRVGEDDW